METLESFMEDPKRLRTKLRLDLNDVRKQIDDLESLMETDKSPENVEAHKKLADYETKLKSQYEKMTGITLDQAQSLKDKALVLEGRSESKLAKLLSAVAGLLFALGFYNITLRGIAGEEVMNVIDYFSGVNDLAKDYNSLMILLSDDTAMTFLVIPLAASAFLFLITPFLSKKGSTSAKFFESLGFVIGIGYFILLTVVPTNAEDVATRFETNILVFGVIFVVGGILILFALNDQLSKLGILLILVSAGLLIDTGAQLIITSMEDDVIGKIWKNWPWMMAPLIGAGAANFLKNLTR